MVLADLDFGQTVVAGALNSLFTALLVGGFAALAVARYQARASDRRRAAEERHEADMLARQLEYQSREALRATYAKLLVAQRRSREASLGLSKADPSQRDQLEQLEQEAVQARDEFIDSYHHLNLDVSPEMWRDVRALRRVLEDMLKHARQHDSGTCGNLVEVARDARQNLERSFRIRLGYEPLQRRKDLKAYDVKIAAE
ncbi:hypothetical protein [Nonomuraea sp. GTA35]|uniref:hypothetical protein n=1 Tax=Nonomuraea sp. GTA35 TaxID=1676746 RepID=UPI0035C06147